MTAQTKLALVLGATGGLNDEVAARGCAVIVHAANRPGYSRWAALSASVERGAAQITALGGRMKSLRTF